MEVQAYIRIRRDGGGEFQFGLVSGQLDGAVEETATIATSRSSCLAMRI
jgi:hypothetical protein